MKKQKKPIILVVALIALFGGVAFMNKPAPSLEGQTTPQSQEPPVEDKADVSKSVADEVKKKDKAKEDDKAVKNAPGPDGMPKHKGGPPDTPSILKIKSAPFKAKPNDSTTSTQWYTKESAKNTPIK